MLGDKRQDRLNNKVWVKDGKEVEQRTSGAKQITKQAWRQSQDKVWVKDGKEANKEHRVPNRLLNKLGD